MVVVNLNVKKDVLVVILELVIFGVFFCYGQTIIFTVLYIASKNLYCMLGIIISLILAHMFIFPDYMNKILPYDLRSIKGNYREAPLIIAPIILIIYFLMISSFI